MSEQDSKKEEREGLDPEELDEVNAEELPDREVMSTFTYEPGPFPLEPPA